MPAVGEGAIVTAAALALIALGGGLYEVIVVDAVWPRRPELIQPSRGGLTRRRFWIPVHVAVELGLVVALIATWSRPVVRGWLLLALTSHLVMRLWSAFDFIPKALAFEQEDPAAIDDARARAWAQRSRWRLLLDLITCGALVAALVTMARG